MYENLVKPNLLLLLAGAVLLVGLHGVNVADAQECPRSRQKLSLTIPATADPYNPIPADGDLELPMPCNAKMILRHVCAPAASLFNDLPFESGCINCRSRERRFMEERRQSAISGPFTLNDLPEACGVDRQGPSFRQ